MPVIDARTDLEASSLTFVIEHDAAVERVWRLWSDPRQLERWWGPPGWPATVTEHELTVGGRVSYHMTGPEGEIAAAWMRFTEIDAPWHLRFDEGFSHEDGTTIPRCRPGSATCGSRPSTGAGSTRGASARRRSHARDGGVLLRLGRRPRARDRYGHDRGLHLGGRSDRGAARRLIRPRDAGHRAPASCGRAPRAAPYWR